ncbi:unnamed protein product [Caretta caretta]
MIIREYYLDSGYLKLAEWARFAVRKFARKKSKHMHPDENTVLQQHEKPIIWEEVKAGSLGILSNDDQAASKDALGKFCGHTSVWLVRNVKELLPLDHCRRPTRLQPSRLAGSWSAGGEVYFSHLGARSAGVATLFSPKLRPEVLGVAEVVPGHLLHVWACVEGLILNLLNVYAPNAGPERVRFYRQALAFLGTLDPHECLVLGGDFNTTLEGQDRSGVETSQAAVGILREIVDHHSLVDVWRDHHPDDDVTLTYVWVEEDRSRHSWLDRIYISRFHLAQAHASSVRPAPFSDHHMVTVTASLHSERPALAYWHFNNSLLEDVGFMDLVIVWAKSLQSGFLPLSSRRAVLALLLKKGDLRDLRNWHPVSLLSTDYKVVAKAISLWLGFVLADVVHPNQTYTIPGQTIFDNLYLVRDLLELGRRDGLSFALLSLDQEKAFDRVDHGYLLGTVRAFDFGPQFVGFLQVLYANAECLVRLNWTLTEPVSFGRGVRQGCPLSGQLYALAIEPFLRLLRQRLTGLALREPELRLVLSAYADNVLLVVQDPDDLVPVEACQAVYSAASSARVNWVKSSGLVVGDGWQASSLPPALHAIRWSTGPLLYLGVYLSTTHPSPPENWQDLEARVGNCDSIRFDYYKGESRKDFDSQQQEIDKNYLTVQWGGVWNRL